MSKTSLMPTRRTVMRTAVWTAPAVSLAVASPAFASSGEQAVQVVGAPAVTGTNGKGRVYQVSLASPGTGLVYMYLSGSIDDKTVPSASGWTRVGTSTAPYVYSHPAFTERLTFSLQLQFANNGQASATAQFSTSNPSTTFFATLPLS